MANADTAVDLGKLHQAITSDITAAFPILQTVEFYREETDRLSFTAPACLLQLSEFENAPDLDPGTEQLAVQARFEARLIIGFQTPSAKLTIRKMAAAMAAWLRLRRFTNPDDITKKLPTGPAQVIGCFPDDFDPRLDQFEVWRVEWTQVVHLGETVWTDEGVVPQQILFNWAPEIGIPHEADYKPIIPEV